MKLKRIFVSVFVLGNFGLAFAAGDYELALMSEEICNEFGQKSVNAHGAKKKGVPKSKVLSYYSKDLAKAGVDGELTRKVIDYGYDEATSTNQAGMRGWAMCKDVMESEIAKIKSKGR